MRTSSNAQKTESESTDWQFHVFSGLDAYFPRKDNESEVSLRNIKIHSKSAYSKSNFVVCQFHFKNKLYIGFFEFFDGHICGEIHFVKDIVPDHGDIMNIKGIGLVSIPTGSFKIVSEFISASCEKDVIKTAKAVEEIIKSHYEDEGGDGNSTSPLIPENPKDGMYKLFDVSEKDIDINSNQIKLISV